MPRCDIMNNRSLPRCDLDLAILVFALLTRSSFFLLLLFVDTYLPRVVDLVAA